MGDQSLWNPGDYHGSLPLELDDVHDYGDVGRIVVEMGEGIKMVAEAKSHCLAQPRSALRVQRLSSLVLLSLP